MQINYTAAKGYNVTTLAAFEFGNELQGKISAETYSEDLLRVRALINAAWPDARSRPTLVANDENPDAGYWASMLPLVGDAISAATWHMYCGYGLDPNLANDAWNHMFMACIDKTASPLLSAGKQWSSDTGGSFWVGETAMAWHSGRDNVTNTFLSTPWWLTQLGTLSATHAVQCRQTLVGGYYELINRTAMQPNPDFWAALLWKRVMGPCRLSASNSAGGPCCRSSTVL